MQNNVLKNFKNEDFRFNKIMLSQGGLQVQNIMYYVFFVLIILKYLIYLTIKTSFSMKGMTRA